MTFVSGVLTITSTSRKKTEKGRETVVLYCYEVIGTRTREYVIGFVGADAGQVPESVCEGRKVLVTGDIIAGQGSMFRLLGKSLFLADGRKPT